MECPVLLTCKNIELFLSSERTPEPLLTQFHPAAALLPQGGENQPGTSDVLLDGGHKTLVPVGFKAELCLLGHNEGLAVPL